MPFRAPIKVSFGDIDNAGIVYYPRFLHYFHLAFEDFFVTQLGIEYSDVLHKKNVSLPTVHMESDFHRRLEYGDRMDMEVRVITVGQTSITWGYRGYLVGEKEEIVVEGHTVTVCVRTDTFEKIKVPEWLRHALQDSMQVFGNA
ncbi:MAG: thioesterase family protein [Desulfatiglandaceae bacterium]|jgi:4-hydroxybenzoyl-CoA thioesterase